MEIQMRTERQEREKRAKESRKRVCVHSPPLSRSPSLYQGTRVCVCVKLRACEHSLLLAVRAKGGWCERLCAAAAAAMVVVVWREGRSTGDSGTA